MSRKFDEKEVALIFQQATELDVPVEGQRETYSPSDLRGGLDLPELKEIAVQVGVDPTRVDQAARSLMIRPRPSPRSVFLGTPTDIEMESEFDVRLRLSDEIRGDLLREIRTVTARQGVTEGQSGSFEWKAEGHLFRRYVTISPSSAGTRLTVTGRFKNAARWAAAVGSYFAVVAMASVLAVFTAGGGASGLVMAVLAPIFAVGAIMIPRLTFGRMVARETRKLSQLATRLRTLLASQQPEDSADGDG